MSGAKIRQATHTLLHDIVLETRTTEGEVKEEVLKPAGTSVLVKRTKAKDMRVFDTMGDQPIGATLSMIKRLSNLDDIEVENLDPDDMEELGNLAIPDKPSGRGTGPTA